MRAHKYEPNYTLADYDMWEGDWELIDLLTDGVYVERNVITSFVISETCKVELDLRRILSVVN